VETPFDWGEHEPFTKQGPAFVAGHAFYFCPNGKVILCSYSSVIVFPDTNFIREAIGIVRNGRSPGVSKLPYRGCTKLYRECVCDRHGNFQFSGLPASRYFFAAEVSWVENEQPQSGALLSSSTIRPGMNFVILTNKSP
jgi:hypothetical protein